MTIEKIKEPNSPAQNGEKVPPLGRLRGALTLTQKMIKHISFDLWLTLIKSHPEFKLKRAELIADKFNIKKYNNQELTKLINSVDKIFDRYNMIYDKKLSADKMYCKVLKKIVPEPHLVTMEDAVFVRKMSDALFEDYSPVFLNDNIPVILSQLKEEGYSLNLSSNTGFIESDLLKKTLRKMGIFQYFDFLIFSDEINSSKPSPRFFNEICERTGLIKQHILHVGDNPLADYKGARDFGLNAVLVTNHNYNINDIRNGL